MLPIGAVTDNVRVGVEMPLRFEQPLCRDDNEACTAKQAVLYFFQSGGRAGERGIFVHAVIDDLTLAQTSGNHTGGGVKDHVYRVGKPEPPHRLFYLPGEEIAVRAAYGPIAIRGEREGVKDKNVGLDLTYGFGERLKFFVYARHVL